MSLYAMKPFSDNQTHKVGDSATLLPIKETELKWPAQTGVADPPRCYSRQWQKRQLPIPLLSFPSNLWGRACQAFPYGGTPDVTGMVIILMRVTDCDVLFCEVLLRKQTCFWCIWGCIELFSILAVLFTHATNGLLSENLFSGFPSLLLWKNADGNQFGRKKLASSDMPRLQSILEGGKAGLWRNTACWFAQLLHVAHTHLTRGGTGQSGEGRLQLESPLRRPLWRW